MSRGVGSGAFDGGGGDFGSGDGGEDRSGGEAERAAAGVGVDEVVCAGGVGFIDGVADEATDDVEI